MTREERCQLWLDLVVDARANACELRSMAKEWPSDAPRYLAHATEAYRRAVHYLTNARRLREVSLEHAA